MVGKAGRNDPCPCGSGKKYKKCCLMKEVQQKASQFKEENVKQKEQEKEEAKWERFWNNFENASYSEKLSAFTGYLESPSPEKEVVFDMLVTLLEEIRERKDYEAFNRLVERVRIKRPEIYAGDAAFYALFVVENMALAGEFNDLSRLLEPFAEDPNNLDEFFRVIETLMYHSQSGSLIQVMRRAYPKVMESAEILGYGKDEFAEFLGWLIIFQDLEANMNCEEIIRHVSEYWDLEKDRIQKLIVQLDGGLYKLSRERFLKGYSKRTEAARKILHLTVEFMGWLRGKGVNYSRALLARRVLVDYLLGERHLSRVETGGNLLLPIKATLDAHLARYLQPLSYSPYRVASLTEILPHYYSYLLHKGLIDEREFKGIEKMVSLKEDVLKYFMSNYRDEEVLRAIERSWKG